MVPFSKWKFFRGNNLSNSFLHTQNSLSKSLIKKHEYKILPPKICFFLFWRRKIHSLASYLCDKNKCAPRFPFHLSTLTSFFTCFTIKKVYFRENSKTFKNDFETSTPLKEGYTFELAFIMTMVLYILTTYLSQKNWKPFLSPLQAMRNGFKV